MASCVAFVGRPQFSDSNQHRQSRWFHFKGGSKVIKLTEAERKQMIDLCKNLKGSLTLLQKILAQDLSGAEEDDI